MDIRILVSDHEDSRELALIEVMILSPLGLWKKVESWGIFRDALAEKLVELKEFYGEQNYVSVDCDSCSHDYEVQDCTSNIADSSPVSSKQGEVIQVDFEGLATAQSVSSAGRGNGTSKPSPSSMTSEDASKSSTSYQPAPTDEQTWGIESDEQ